MNFAGFGLVVILFDKFMHSAVPYFASRFHNSPASVVVGGWQSGRTLPLHRISILSSSGRKVE